VEPGPVELLERMLQIPSVSGQEQTLAEFVTGVMKSLGFRAFVDEAGNAVGERGSGPVEVVLLGHIDTVPGQIEVRRDGDKLYGRGAVDAKGPFAAFVSAAASIDVPSECKVVVVGAVEEEAATSKGARHVLGKYTPAAVIVGEPSGWDRVTVGYKGRLLIDYELTREAAHSARDEESVCESAIDFWSWVKGFSLAYSADQRRQFDKVDCSLRSINSESDGLFERVMMEVALRLPVDFDAQSFMEAARGMAASARLQFRGYEQAVRASKNTVVVRSLLRAIRAAGGQPFGPARTLSSYARCCVQFVLLADSPDSR